MKKGNRVLLRKRLLKELAEVSRGVGLRDALTVEIQSEPIDQLQAEEDRELACERIEEHTKTAHEIEAALHKLDEGTYGKCERCARSIPEMRLRAIPWASHCLGCQALIERNAA